MITPFTVIYFWRQSRLGSSEGLNVLLTDLIRGLSDCGVPVQVLTTSRHAAGLQDVLLKNSISPDSVEVIKLIKGSPFLALRDYWDDKRKRKIKRKDSSIIKRVKQIISRWGEQFLSWALDLTVLNAPLKLLVTLFILASLTVFGLSVGVVGSLGLVSLSLLVAAVAILAIPPFVILSILLRRSPRQFMRMFLSRAVLRIVQRRVKSSWVAISERLYQAESARMGKAIDRASNISAVFIPSAFEGYLCASVARVRKLIVFPDVTPLLFPTRFPGGQYSDFLLASMRQSVTHSDGIICYSNFVRDVQLRKIFKEISEGKSVDVIPQGFFVDEEFGEPRLSSNNDLNSFIKNYFPEYGPLPKAFFGEFSFIIYPTVDRPHKNTLTLLRAFERLLRERGRNIKLVLTSPGGTVETMAFIRERKLHRDVLFMPAVPIVVLNQLISKSSVMVHSSLAEGGDIFNFSRAVSNGTPALLSDIAVTREMFDRYGLEQATYLEWLFEATDERLLANKIDSIICGNWQPLLIQRVELERLSGYRFSNMAAKYNDSFKKLIEPLKDVDKYKMSQASLEVRL